jgi:hypothetical protein
MKKEHYVIFISKKSAIFAPTNPNGGFAYPKITAK